MSWDQPIEDAAALAAPKEDPMRAFLRDQVEAVGILREEQGDERTSRRLDACHLALRYLESQQSSESHTPAKVIAVAKTFERYLLEP